MNVLNILKTWLSRNNEPLPALTLDPTTKVDIDHEHDVNHTRKPEPKKTSQKKLHFPMHPDRDEFGDDIPACEPYYLRRTYEPESLQLSDGEADRSVSVVTSLTVVTVEEYEDYCNSNPVHLEFAEQVSVPGLGWKNGLPASHEHNSDFTPVKARGKAGKSLGEFHKNFIGSTTFRRGWSSIVQALGTGNWSVSPPNLDSLPLEEKEALREEYEERCRVIERALTKNLYGGWKQFLHDSMYCLIAGFSIFEEVYNDDGTIEKLAFIFPSSLSRWILDADERELVAVEFAKADGALYTIDAENLLIMSWDKFGNLFEGIAVMRSTVRWIEALQLFSHLEMVAAEKYGVPHTYVSRKDENSTRFDQEAIKQLEALMSAAVAAENPIIVLPDNTEIKTTSPAGAMPNFDIPKRFCLERILEPLKAEGSLIGIGQTGAFAARKDASEERVSSFPYFAEFIAEALNGADNVPYSGTIKKMEDTRFGGPVVTGEYCQLKFSISDLDAKSGGPGQMNRIAAAANAGLLTPDIGVENTVREFLDIPPVIVNPDTTLEVPDEV